MRTNVVIATVAIVTAVILTVSAVVVAVMRHPREDELVMDSLEYKQLAETLRELTPETDYVEHRVICGAANEQSARQTAEIVGGTLESFEHGVGIIRIEETVLELVTRLSESTPPLPRVEPDYCMSMQIS